MTNGDIAPQPWSLDVRIAAPPERDHVTKYVLRVNDSNAITHFQQIELRCDDVTDLPYKSSVFIDL